MFSPIMKSENIIIKYAIHPFDLCEKNINLWNNIKLLFCIFYLISSLIISNFIYNFLFKNNIFLNKNIQKNSRKNFQNNIKNSQKYFKKFRKNNENNLKINHKKTNKNNEKNKKNKYNEDINQLSIFIGFNDEKQKISISESGLYQNILVTGTIGSGKTSSALYPITKQLLSYQHNNYNKKIGMLVLDVKGNYYKKIKEFAYEYDRMEDIAVLEINGAFTYNPLDKPELKASVLANRLRIILDLFSGKSSEPYWTDKAEQILTECIKFCRLYNNGYVNFEEIHKLVTSKQYYENRLNLVRELYVKNKLSNEECYNLSTAINFFEKEYFKLDDRTMSILKSQITRITGCFMSDYNVSKTFNSRKNNNNSINLNEVVEDGKIIILNMNIAQYKNLSKIIAAYLKLDFQSEVLSRLSNEEKNRERAVAFISDEYQEYITESDADFYAQSREAKCINVVATQSYTSLLKTLGNESVLKVVIQNLINKIWFRTDDLYTIEEAQKQIGKIENEKITTNISESAKETKYSYINNNFRSKDSNISESISSSYEKDFVFDVKFFTQELHTFQAIAFLSDGSKITEPQKIELIPYFKMKKMKGCDLN